MAMAGASPAVGRDYRVTLDSLDVSVVSGDILKACTDVVVTGDDPHLTGSGGVSRALIMAGGVVYTTARTTLLTKEVLECGKVYPTDPGQLPCSHVFHAISMRPRRLDKKWEDVMSGLYQQMVEKTVRCGANSFATPLLGTGHACVPCTEAVRVAIKGLLAASHQQGQTVRVLLFVNDPVAKVAAVEELKKQSSHRPLPVPATSKSGGHNPGSSGHVSSFNHHSQASAKSPPKQPASSSGSVRNKRSSGGLSPPPPAGGRVSPSRSPGGVSPSPRGASPTRSTGPSPAANTATSPGKRPVGRSKSSAGKSTGSSAGATGVARAVSVRSTRASSAKTQSPLKRDSPLGAAKQPPSSRNPPGGAVNRPPSASCRQSSASAKKLIPGSKRKSVESPSGDGGSSDAGGTAAAQLGAGVSPSGYRGQRLTRSMMMKSGDASDAKTAAGHGGARPKVRTPAPRSSSSEEDDGSNARRPGVENGVEGPEDNEECAICRDDISDPEKLQCGHTFCKECIQQAFLYKPVCPSCGTIHGVITGTQPQGHMTVSTLPSSLPGYDGHDTFIIDYSLPSGIQGEEHPNPGCPFHGTFRRAFLPQSPEGELALRMLRVAFQRRMVFTVGRSTTTGRDNVVTWNDIHHKTSIDGGPQRFGYPDPGYLRRLREELESKGVREEDTVGVSAL